MESFDREGAIIIDNGTGVCKAGFEGNDGPSAVFSSVVGRPQNDEMISAMGLKNAYVGDEAQTKRGILQLRLRYPAERGNVWNWDDMEKIWHHLFDNELRVESWDHPILVTDSTFANTKGHNNGRFAEMLYEHFNVVAMNIANQSVLSLFGTGRITGISCSFGEGVSQIVPVQCGIPLSYASVNVGFAGCDLTDYLKRLLFERGFLLTTSAEHEVVREIKEKLSFVALDFDNEMQAEATLDDKYELPDGQVISLNNERFRCTEALFQPSLLQPDTVLPSIPDALHSSIMKCDTEVQQELCRSIVLSGGTATCPGFQQRLLQETTLRAPSTTLRIHKPVYPKNAAWIGGAILSSVMNTKKGWIHKSEYDESGPSIIQSRRY